MSHMFEKVYLINYPDFQGINTSNVIDMSYMFNETKFVNFRGLQEHPNLLNLNTTNVKNMEYMFSNDDKIPNDVSLFNISNVNNMSHLFAGKNNGKELGDISLSNWDTS